MASGASIVNFALCSTVIIIIEFNQINTDWAWATKVSGTKFAFSNWEKYIALWSGDIYWAACFHSY